MQAGEETIGKELWDLTWAVIEKFKFCPNLKEELFGAVEHVPNVPANPSEVSSITSTRRGSSSSSASTSGRQIARVGYSGSSCSGFIYYSKMIVLIITMISHLPSNLHSPIFYELTCIFFPVLWQPEVAPSPPHLRPPSLNSLWMIPMLSLSHSLIFLSIENETRWYAR